MRIVRIFLLQSLLLLAFSTKAQNSWDVYEIGKIFSLSVPPTMALRDPGSVVGKEIDNAVKKITLQYGVSAADWKYTFMPSEGIASSKYARVIVFVSRQNHITQKMVKDATQADLAEIKAAREAESKQLGIGLKNFTVKKELCGGKYAIVLNYDRSGLSGDIHVADYMFYLLNKQIEITISYRISESSYWKKDFSAIPGTFTFE